MKLHPFSLSGGFDDRTAPHTKTAEGGHGVHVSVHIVKKIFQDTRPARMQRCCKSNWTVESSGRFFFFFLTFEHMATISLDVVELCPSVELQSGYVNKKT